jgi:hypothetical protein
MTYRLWFKSLWLVYLHLFTPFFSYGNIIFYFRPLLIYAHSYRNTTIEQLSIACWVMAACCREGGYQIFEEIYLKVPSSE